MAINLLRWGLEGTVSVKKETVGIHIHLETMDFLASIGDTANRRLVVGGRGGNLNAKTGKN